MSLNTSMYKVNVIDLYNPVTKKKYEIMTFTGKWVDIEK